jgi:hypothetical protein
MQSIAQSSNQVERQWTFIGQDFVQPVFSLRPDELYVDVLHPVSNCDDQPVIIPFNVEHNPIVRDDACIGVLILYILQRCPLR